MLSKNLLGLDLGEKYLGVAISIDGAFPLGLETVYGNEDIFLKRLKVIIFDNQINVLVAGIPSGKVHGDVQKEKLLFFLKKIQKAFLNIKVETVNEDFTSKIASYFVSKEKVHQESARIILESFMNNKDAI